MSAPAPLGATCARHPEAPATWTCKRCGGFMCAACERRVRPDALPLCTNCWMLRSLKVPGARRSNRLESAGLWLGGLSFTCLPPVVMAAVVINLMALVRAPPGEWRRPLVGLALTGGGVAVMVSLILIFFSRT